MSIYNVYLGYGGGIVDKAAGLVGFADDSPGTNKTYRLPPFNQIKIEIWGAGGSGGGGDHNVTATGTGGSRSRLIDFGLEAGGGGAGIGGNNNGTKKGTGGGGGVSSGTYPTGVIALVNGNSGASATDSGPGVGGEAGNAPGTSGPLGTIGGSPGGGGGGAGYDNGAAPGGGKKSGGGSVKDAAAGGGGGGGGYVSAQFVKGQIPQRMVITYDVGSGGTPDPAEYTGGKGANGRIKITWS
jgi:hypothetical protein